MEGAIKKRKVEEEELPVLPRVLHPLIISHFDAKTLMKMRCVCRLWRDFGWKLVTEKTRLMFFRSKTEEDCECADDECDDEECVKRKLFLQFRNRRTMRTELTVSTLPHFVENTLLMKNEIRKMVHTSAVVMHNKEVQVLEDLEEKSILNWKYARMKPEQNLIFVPCFSMQCILMCTILDFKILRAYHFFDISEYQETWCENYIHIYIPDNCSDSLIIKYYSDTRSDFARLFLDSSKATDIITSETNDDDSRSSHLNRYTCTKRDGTLCLLWDCPRPGLCEIVINPGLSNQKNVIIRGKFQEVKDAGSTIGIKFKNF